MFTIALMLGFLPRNSHIYRNFGSCLSQDYVLLSPRDIENTETLAPNCHRATSYCHLKTCKIQKPWFLFGTRLCAIVIQKHAEYRNLGSYLSQVYELLSPDCTILAILNYQSPILSHLLSGKIIYNNICLWKIMILLDSKQSIFLDKQQIYNQKKKYKQ